MIDNILNKTRNFFDYQATLLSRHLSVSPVIRDKMLCTFCKPLIHYHLKYSWYFEISTNLIVWLPNRELAVGGEGGVTGEVAAKPITAVQDCVSTFVSEGWLFFFCGDQNTYFKRFLPDLYQGAFVPQPNKTRSTALSQYITENWTPEKCNVATYTQFCVELNGEAI